MYHKYSFMLYIKTNNYRVFMMQMHMHTHTQIHLIYKIYYYMIILCIFSIYDVIYTVQCIYKYELFCKIYINLINWSRLFKSLH